MRNRQSDDPKNNSKKVLAAVSVLVAVALMAGAVAGWQLYRSAQAEKKMKQLAEMTWTLMNDSGKGDSDSADGEEAAEDDDSLQDKKSYPTLSQLGIPIPEKSVNISAFQENANADIYSWIYIPDTGIDYPVLQHPEELDYYLEYNIDGSKGRPGCIYTQRMNSKDWTDKNTVIYGHNMWTNGTMFNHLHYYEDAAFFEENPYIYIYTEDTLKAYQIFAAYEYSDRNVLMVNDTSTDESYLRYLDSIFENEGLNNNFDTGVEFDARDRIITLSTCIKNKDTRRYLVQAVLVAEESSI